MRLPSTFLVTLPMIAPFALHPSVSRAQTEGQRAVTRSDVTSESGPPGQKAVQATVEPKVPFNGFQIRSDDADSWLKLGGLLQADGRFFLHGDGVDTFVVRRARIDLRAKLAKFFGVRLHPEFAGSSPSLLDAYATLGFVDEVELQVGKMKAPLGLELLQSPSEFVFPELGLPGRFVYRTQGYYYFGPLGVLGEYVRSTQDVSNGTDTVGPPGIERLRAC